MTTDTRALRDAEVVEEEKKKAEFLSKELSLVESSWNVDSAVSVYIYLERHEQDDSLWFVINKEGLYYSVFESMVDMMECLEKGLYETHYLELTPEEMRLVDDDID